MSLPKKPLSPDKELARELEHLRLLFRETLSAYSNRVEGQLLHIIDALQDVAGLTQKSRGRSKKSHPVLTDLAIMRDAVNTLQIKPRKGRRKDLRHMEETISDLLTRIEGW